MKCIYLKQKISRKLECKKDKNKIVPKNCTNCPFKEFKTQEYSLSKYKTQNNSKMRLKSNKLAKLERNRTSLFTNDLEHCFICGFKKECLHEIYPGKNRTNSMKYQMVLPLCRECHRKLHDNPLLQVKYKKIGQTLFNKVYPTLSFEDIFKINYL